MSDRLSGAAIIETVTTTINPDGTVNCAAMGVEWGERRIVIKPYRGTRTLRNLRARILQRLLALTACVYLNHWLGRPSRALVDYVA
jgi:hypothetical protein